MTQYHRLIGISVLLEAPVDPLRRQMNSVLLTVDLTKAVADEAIERNDSIVIAYRTSNGPNEKENTDLIECEAQIRSSSAA